MCRKCIYLIGFRHRRICDDWNHLWIYWKRHSEVEGLSHKPRTVETERSQLLTGIEENSAAATDDCLPVRYAMKNVRDAQPWRKVVPGSLPKRRTLRRQF